MESQSKTTRQVRNPRAVLRVAQVTNLQTGHFDNNRRLE